MSNSVVKPEIKKLTKSISETVNALCSSDDEKAKLYHELSAFCNAKGNSIKLPKDYLSMIDSINNYLKNFD